MIHAQVVHPDDFARFGRLRLVAEVNPYHAADDMRWMEERIGKRRSEGAYAFRALKDAGAVLVFGSDSPGTNAARYYLNPVYGIYAAVTRQTLKGDSAPGWFPDERLTIEEAMEADTRGARLGLLRGGTSRARCPPGGSPTSPSSTRTSCRRGGTTPRPCCALASATRSSADASSTRPR